VLAELKTDIDGLPGSKGPATPAPAVKKACIELDSKGACTRRGRRNRTDGLETLVIDGVEGSDKGGLLVRSAAKAA